MEMELEPILIVLDTEFESSNMITGNFLQLGLVAIFDNVSIPLCELDDNKWLVDSLSVCMKDQGKEKEKSTMKFWSIFPEIHHRIQSEAIPIEQGMKQVQQWLNMLSTKYKISNFIADISCVDFSWFRNLLLTHCNMEENLFTLPYKALCQYSMEEALIMTGIVNKQDIRNCYKQDRFPHTHYALDDALRTAYEYLLLKCFMKEKFTVANTVMTYYTKNKDRWNINS